MENNLLNITREMRSFLMETFGTDDENELRQIARKAKRYDKLFQNRHPVNIRNAGRKSLFSQDDILKMEIMFNNGESILNIAAYFHTSRQTISKYIAPKKRIGRNRFVTMRMQYMYENELCTTIDVDFMNKKIYIKNSTDDIIHRAFGVITNPTWEDFEQFLEMRCFPKTRSNLKNVLRDTGVSSYDPLQIIEKTQGRMAEDKQWIKIIYLQRRDNNYGNN